MFIKVRKFNAASSSLAGATGEFSLQINSVNSTIREVKNLLFDQLCLRSKYPTVRDEEVDRCVRIFFNGKELESRFTVFQYEIKLENVIQVLVNEGRLRSGEPAMEPSRRGSSSSLDCEGDASEDATGTSSSGASDIANNSPLNPPHSDTSDWIECDKCLDDITVKCKCCSCCVCGGKNDPDKQIICDECNNAYHLWCHREPPLHQLPPEEEDWYCHECVNNDRKLIQEKELAHLQKIAARSKSTKRRRESASCEVKRKKEKGNEGQLKVSWGHGMACVGRRYSDLSRSYGSDFYGAIPGVEVGTTWRYRFQVSEAGLHTPLVAGIAGKEAIGASSIVFSGTYSDDVDLGDDIYYTGSGGHGVTEASGARSSGNRPQVADQTLKRANKALAMSCAAPFNPLLGASAGHNWKSGKPIRVLRSGNSKCTKLKSPFCPPQGIRYDGIYHIVKYWPERSKTTNMIVWRFHLKRNDTSPAPWTKEGKNRMRRLVIDKVIEPANDPLVSLTSTSESSAEKQSTGMPSNFISLVKKDEANRKIWQHLMSESSLDSGHGFMRLVGQSFRCACCIDIAINQPVTSKCGHIFCRGCLKKSLEQTDTAACPVCRCPLTRKLPAINRPLEQILRTLYPFASTIKE